MDVNKFFSEALSLSSPWSLDQISVSDDDSILLTVKYNLNSYIDTDGTTYKLYDKSPERRWQHLSILQYRSYIVCKVPRYKNAEGLVKTVPVPWADSHQSYTNLFANFVIDLLQCIQVQSSVSEICQTTPIIVRSIMDQSVEKGMHKRGFVTNLRHISIDEKAFKKGHEYATILINAQDNSVIELTEGRDTSHAKLVLYNATGLEQIESIKTVTLDMWKPFINAMAYCCPNAIQMHDKFHLIAKISEAINKTRQLEVKTEPLLKNQKFTVLKNAANRTVNQQEKFEQINAANLETSKVWKARENFKAIFESYDHLEIIEMYDLWLDNALRIGNKYLNKVCQTFERHLDGILNAIVYKKTNAKHERKNGVIQSVIAKARGFYNFERFRINVLFYCGKLELKT